MIDDEQRGFRSGRGRVDKIFTLKQIVEKAREKKCRVYVVLAIWRRNMIGLIGKHYGRS